MGTDRFVVRVIVLGLALSVWKARSWLRGEHEHVAECPDSSQGADTVEPGCGPSRDRVRLDMGASAAHVGTMATIYEQLRADIITSMKARDQVTTTALRTADAAIKRAAMDANVEITDALVIATLRKAVKNLADANVEFEKGGRSDLIAANTAEIKVLEKYLPQGLPPEQVDALIAAAIQETGAQSKKDMGKVIGVLKKSPQAALLDFAAVSKAVQAKLP